MTLFMPIQPEPASRIYSGKKLYELRKFPPPETGFVYLYESKDETASIQAIRGGFFFREYLNLPLDKLWARVGERATSREKFLHYFGSKHKNGIALSIEKVEILSAPVTLNQLRAIDPDFDLPKGLWTYHRAPDSSLAVQYLNGIPREKVIVHDELQPQTLRRDLEVAPLAGRNQEDLFSELCRLYVLPNYPDCEDYTNFVLRIHKNKSDQFGYFTRRKTVWTLNKGTRPIGFTVVTEKRGGSIKFGPTVVIPGERGQGIATAFRLLVERQYPNARKAYNTLPDDNLSALRYVLRAGYHVEAHLRSQYKATKGELVVGKLLMPPSLPPSRPAREPAKGDLILTDGKQLPASELARLVAELLNDFYTEVDAGFVAGLVNAMQAEASFSTKHKRVLFAMRGGSPAGIVIVTPKRGGALKCSPLVIRGEDPECLHLLLDSAERCFPQREPIKTYFHVPLLTSWIVEEALSRGFTAEGVLREPYHPGIDVLAMGRVHT